MPIGKLLHAVTIFAELVRLNAPGELFDLEALARSCEELQRWTFFVTSVPLNMPGGVSSPPNIMAIF